MSQSVINWTVTREYMLKCSRERRAGKFDRVAESILIEAESGTESIIRQVYNPNALALDIVQPGDDREFITGAALEKVRERLNHRVRALIQAMVQRHPSIGKTLQGS